MIIKKIMPKSSIAKKRVAAYCRVSTLREDQVESFETQRRYYTDLIESHPEWEMVKIYADRHSATKAENRPGFQEMAADAKARKLDIILCKSISSKIGLTLRLREQFLPVVNDVWQINGIPAGPSVIAAVIGRLQTAAELDNHTVRSAL